MPSNPPTTPHLVGGNHSKAAPPTLPPTSPAPHLVGGRNQSALLVQHHRPAGGNHLAGLRPNSLEDRLPTSTTALGLVSPTTHPRGRLTQPHQHGLRIGPSTIPLHVVGTAGHDTTRGTGPRQVEWGDPAVHLLAPPMAPMVMAPHLGLVDQLRALHRDHRQDHHLTSAINVPSRLKLGKGNLMRLHSLFFVMRPNTTLGVNPLVLN